VACNGVLMIVCCLLTACNCDYSGAYGVSCDQQTGQCDCRPTFDGLTCNKCKPNFYNYPICEGRLCQCRQQLAAFVLKCLLKFELLTIYFVIFCYVSIPEKTCFSLGICYQDDASQKCRKLC